MAVPRSRVSNARKNSRRAHDAKSLKNPSKCKNCGNSRIPHRICPHCGTYANRVIYETKSS